MFNIYFFAFVKVFTESCELININIMMKGSVKIKFYNNNVFSFTVIPYLSIILRYYILKINMRNSY